MKQTRVEFNPAGCFAIVVTGLLSILLCMLLLWGILVVGRSMF